MARTLTNPRRTRALTTTLLTSGCRATTSIIWQLSEIEGLMARRKPSATTSSLHQSPSMLANPWELRSEVLPSSRIKASGASPWLSLARGSCHKTLASVDQISIIFKIRRIEPEPWRICKLITAERITF